MPAADAHVHLFAGGFSGTFGSLLRSELDLYESLRVEFAIEHALVVGYEGETRYAGNNEYILELGRTRPWIVPLAYLRGQPEIALLHSLCEAGTAGYSLYLFGEAAARAASTWPAGVLSELNRQQAIVSFNADPEAIAALAPLVDALGGCTLLFSHLGLPGRIDRMTDRATATTRLGPLLALADRPHVNVKLSGLYAISDPPHDFPHREAQPFLDAVLEAFGHARVCWGSDFAPALDFVSFGQLADTRLLEALSDDETAAVMGGNLRRLLQDRGKRN